MRAFIACRLSGEDPNVMSRFLNKVSSSLSSRAIGSYCTLIDDPDVLGAEPKKVMANAFAKIGDCDFLLAIITGEEKSEGMLLEFGHCLTKGIPILVAIKDGVEGTKLPKLATVWFPWSDLNNLCGKLETMGYRDLERAKS